MCNGVVAPAIISKKCSRKDKLACPAAASCKLWFVDDPTQLIQRKNWNKEALDILLERTYYCSKSANC